MPGNIITRPQPRIPKEEFGICIDFHNVLDLAQGARFQYVDGSIVERLREILVDTAPARLHICSFTGQAQAAWYWENNLQPALEQLKEAFSSPTTRVTAGQVFQRTLEDGKVWRLARLTPTPPHVHIDDNRSICQEARRTNALVFEVNKTYPAFQLPVHRYLPHC